MNLDWYLNSLWSNSLISLAFFILQIVAFWKVFEKAGKSGWLSLIPLVNIYVFFEIAWGNGMWALTLLIPGVNFFTLLICFAKFAKAFGKDMLFQTFMMFLPYIGILFIGFDNSEYLGSQKYVD